MEIPELQTERLTLRTFVDGDLDAYAAICADPEVTEFIGGVAWGRGYATEAARAALAWAHGALALDRIVSVIDPANTRSIAVAERLGMSAKGKWESRRGPTTIYGRTLPL